jgi:hypothetical protein
VARGIRSAGLRDDGVENTEEGDVEGRHAAVRTDAGIKALGSPSRSRAGEWMVNVCAGSYVGIDIK